MHAPVLGFATVDAAPYITGAPGLANWSVTKFPGFSALVITTVPNSVTGLVSPAKGIARETTGIPALPIL